LEDLNGQVTEAVSKAEFWKKWGRHYLPSLLGAHLNQQCNNFKDPGVQGYMGALFRTVRDGVDETFLKLPAPRPSGVAYGRAAAAPIQLADYNNSAGPCFAGSSHVKLSDGPSIQLEFLEKGDRVATPEGDAEVVCVVETFSAHGSSFLLCELPGGLLITPWHPIRHEGAWAFPVSLAKPSMRRCKSIFSVLLDRHHVLEIDGVQCVALGHGFQDKIVAHPYFGSDKDIRADLSLMRGWNRGHICLQAPGCLVRDDASGIVCRLVQHAESA